MVRRDEWIMDGNYTGTLPERVAVADGIVFFDINRVMCVAGVVQRFLGHRFRLRADLPEGCAERLSWEFLRWIWDFPRKFRPAVLAALQQRGADVPLVTIRTRAEAARALARLRRLALGSGGAGSGGWGPSAPRLLGHRLACRSAGMEAERRAAAMRGGGWRLALSGLAWWVSLLTGWA